MNVQQPLHMAKPDFMAWVQAQDGRYELDDGRVLMMVGVSRAHGRIVRNLARTIDRQIDARQWEVLADFGLDTGPRSLRYPDVVVDRVDASGADFTASEPVFVAEVLSPTTESVDLGDKAAEYLKLPSLRAYLILAQDRAKAWLWLRGEHGFAPGSEIVVGLDKTIRIASLNLELPLAGIYAGVEVGP